MTTLERYKMRNIAVQKFREIRDLNSGYEPERTLIHLLSPEAVVQFRNILSRALNCAPPHEEQYRDWFELAEMLEGRKEIKGPSQGV